MRAFDRLARTWERNARIDALWAILALPGKEGGAWDPREFFATGERDVADLFRYMESHGATPRPGRALDFGCGVGRLTRALAQRSERVDGVDVSPTMIAAARRFAQDEPRIRYHVVAMPDLRTFPSGSFDLGLSILVLQHIPPPFAEGYIRELARVAAPGGVLLFQVPHAPRATRVRAGRARRLAGKLLAATPLRPRQVTLEMYGVPRPNIERILLDAGCEIVDIRPDGWAGPEWESYVYLARRPAT